jgi:hypothetical protein
MAFNARDFFTRFATAVNARDRATLEPMFHPDFSATSPQTGEIARGFAQFWEQLLSYPGGAPDMPLLPEARLYGDDERWAITPSYTVVPLKAPNEFTVIDRTQYPDGTVWHSVALVEIRDELLFRLELFFAPEMPAPLAQSMAAFGGEIGNG